MNDVIAYQGEPGANSHIACLEVRPDWQALACATFEDAFTAIDRGRAKLAMIPIENSVAGRVADIHHLLPTSGLQIVGEHFLPIHHQLVGIPGAAVDELTSVQSHVHALGQCRKALRRLGVTAVVGADTAGSARQVAEAGNPVRAAIASRLAAEVYGLEILAEDIEDESHNTTRFVLLAKSAAWAHADGTPTVTSFVFRVRNLPAALYKALGGFATNGVNMTKLESYMVGGEFSATLFYAEVEGHPEDAALGRALEELGYFSKQLTLLGVYPAHPFRVQGARADTAG
jgi:prephenate dehydratase